MNLKRGSGRHQTTVRHTPQQNGLAERDNRTLFEGVRTLLASNKALPITLWAEATNHKIYVLNRSLSSTCPTMTPHEAWYNVKPDLSTLRIFGSEFYVLVPKQVREGKLESVGVLVYFVGNSETQKGERYYDPSSGKVNASRDTTSVRRHFEPRLSSSDLTTAQRDVITLPPTGVYTPTSAHPEIEPPTLPQQYDSTHELEEREDAGNHEEVTDVDFLRPSQLFSHQDAQLTPSAPSPAKKRRSVRIRTTEEESQAIDSPPLPTPRRSSRVPQPKHIVSMRASLAADTVLIHEEEPDQYQDAMTSDHATEWKAATQREYDSLMKNHTWDLVSLPTKRSLIRARWTFKIKPAFKASEKIYKARFVAKGYSQCPGIDYKESEIYSPT